VRHSDIKARGGVRRIAEFQSEPPLCSDDYYDVTAGQCGAVAIGDVLAIEAILAKYGVIIMDGEVIVLYFDDSDDMQVGSIRPRNEDAVPTREEPASEQVDTIASRIIIVDPPSETGGEVADDITTTGPAAQSNPGSRRDCRRQPDDRMKGVMSVLASPRPSRSRLRLRRTASRCCWRRRAQVVGLGGLGEHHQPPLLGSNRRALEVDLRRTGGPIVQDGGEVSAGGPPPHICPCTLARDGTFDDQVK
jgi:hypothetical protein